MFFLTPHILPKLPAGPQAVRGVLRRPFSGILRNAEAAEPQDGRDDFGFATERKAHGVDAETGEVADG